MLPQSLKALGIWHSVHHQYMRANSPLTSVSIVARWGTHFHSTEVKPKLGVASRCTGGTVNSSVLQPDHLDVLDASGQVMVCTLSPYVHENTFPSLLHRHVMC